MTTFLTNDTLNPANQPSGVDSGTAHKVVVSLLVLIVVAVILTEGAGASHDAADAIVLLLIGALLLQGMIHANRFSNFASQYPWDPIGTSTLV